LQSAFVFHGFCDMRKLKAALSEADVCIVPTRTDCEAGFEMTCAEAILANRPLVTSAGCPALEYVEAAAVEAKPEDIRSYRDAILQLADDPALYERKQRACAPFQEQVNDDANGWYAAMRHALSLVPACAKHEA
jgi:glycosyltransferase involved in cell wall biosynthesis